MRMLCNMEMHNLELWSQPHPAISLCCHKPQRLMLGGEMLPLRTDSIQENKSAADSVKPESIWAAVIQWQSVCSWACEANNFWAHRSFSLSVFPFMGMLHFSLATITPTLYLIIPGSVSSESPGKSSFLSWPKRWLSLVFHRQFFHLKIRFIVFVHWTQTPS